MQLLGRNLQPLGMERILRIPRHPPEGGEEGFLGRGEVHGKLLLDLSKALLGVSRIISEMLNHNSKNETH